ncbi:MAG: hypothetical protein ACE5FJ_02230 [Gemmatimonadales bacterium]
MSNIDRRILFQDFKLKQLPDGHCEARVVLTWQGNMFVGQAQATDSPTGQLRCAADAAVAALMEAVSDRISIDLLGVKSIKAFDAMVIVVSLTAREEGGVQRLVGSCIVQANPANGAALAVLNATNRVIGNLISTR